MEERTHIHEKLLQLYDADYLRPETVPYQPILEELSLRTDDVIVELGAGEGKFTLPIARRLAEERGHGVVFACDFSRDLVDRLAERAAEAGVGDHVRAMCLEDIRDGVLPFADERVDAVYAVNMLQYLADPMPYLKEIARVLAPWGQLLMLDLQSHDMTGRDGSPSSAPEDMPSMLRPVGLTLKDRLRMPGFTWGLRIVKSAAFYV